MTALVRNYLEIKAYRQAFALQQRIYQCSRRWPAEEVTALTSRILRAARDIGARLSHAWAIRADDVEFVSRLTEVDAELAETLHWLETARACGYLDEHEYRELRDACASLGKMLAAMARSAQRLSGSEPPSLAPAGTPLDPGPAQ